MPQNLSMAEFEKKYGKAAPEPASISLEEFEKMYGGNPATRAGMQVLQPNNPRSLMDAAGDALGVARQLPGAVDSVLTDYSVGALKGLGGMANTAMGMAGIPMPEYSETAFDPSNPVQGVGKGLTQDAVVGAATAPLMGPAARLIKPITKRLIPVAKAAVEFSGLGERARKAQKAYRIATGADEAAVAAKRAAKEAADEAAAAAKKAAELEKYRGVSQKEYELLKAQEQAKKIDRGRAAKAEFEARKASKQAAKSPESPQAKPEATEGMYDSRTGQRVNLTPEQAKEAVANQPWNKAKKPATKAPESAPEPPKSTGDVVEAKPAFKGQQSAKGATKARFDANLERNVAKWAEGGSKPEVIQARVKQIFKRDLSLDEIDTLIMRAKGK